MSAETDLAQRREHLRRAKLLQAEFARTHSNKRPPHSERVKAKLAAAAEAKAQAEYAHMMGDPISKRVNLDLAKRLEREAWEMDREDLEAHWLQLAIEETVALAESRGEDVEHETVDLTMTVTDEHGATLLHKSGPQKGQPVVRRERVTRTVLKSRGGGLHQAYEKGWLEVPHGGPKAQDLYEIGVKYREAYEISEGNKSGAGVGGGGFGPKGPQLRIIEAGEFLSITRAPLNRRQRRVLDLVCGEDIRCRIAAIMLHAGFPATSRALRSGLSEALEAWETAKSQKLVGAAVRQTKRAARALRTVE